jgi:recombination protein RecT
MNSPAKVPPKKDAIALLQDKTMITQIARALPRHFAPDRMLRIAMTELRKNPKLQKCDPFSFIAAVIQCAQLGLEPGSGLGHAYLVPYGPECTMISGYKGLAELARRSGEVKTLFADLVMPGDKFYFGVKNSVPILDWEPTAEDRDAKHATHGFATAVFKSGEAQPTMMTRAQIDAIGSVSLKKAYNPAQSPWTLHYGEMAKKTVVRRLAKLLPQSPEFVRIQELDDAADSGTQLRMLLEPLVEAGVVDENYDIEPEKQAPLATPKEQDAKKDERAEAVNAFKQKWTEAKAAGLSLGDGAKMLGMQADKVSEQPTAEIWTAVDILADWLKGRGK